MPKHLKGVCFDDRIIEELYMYIYRCLGRMIHIHDALAVKLAFWQAQ